MELGVHLPNRKLRDGELSRILATGCRSFLIYISWLPDTPYWAGVADEIRRRVPGARIHIRFEKRGNFPADPHQDALECTTYARQIRADTYRYRNEVNLEGDGDTPANWQTYVEEFGWSVHLKGLLWGELYVPAISPGGPRAAEFLAASVAAAKAGQHAGLYGGIDCHAYGSLAEMVAELGKFRAQWSGPSVITEHNFGAGRPYDLNTYAREVPANAQAAATRGFSDLILFIWDWATPDMALPTSVSIQGSPLEAALPTIAKTYHNGAITVATLTFERGFKTFATALKLKGIDPGIPKYAPELYVTGSNGFEVAYQETTTGFLIWNKQLNDMFWQGRDRRVVAYNGGILKVAK